MYLELAVRNILRNKIRYTLATLGIVIGVTAIGAIGIFSESLKSTVLENFKDLINEIIILPAYENNYYFIEPKTVKKLEQSPYAEKVIPLKEILENVNYKNKKIKATVYGIDFEIFHELSFNIEEGNIKKSGIVLGNIIAEKLNAKVGSKIKIGNLEKRVSAILEKEGARFDINPNRAIFIPLEFFERNYDTQWSIIIVNVKDKESINAFKNYVDKIINRKEKKINAFELKVVIERIEKVFWRITLFLLAIAAVSLVVAGISILNVMMMATVERTKEIGIMRAIGAPRAVILKIFLIEALLLGFFGSLAGGVLSLVIGYFIDLLILKSVKYVFALQSLSYIFLGILFGVSTAILSGLYPAWKATTFEPIKALRYE